MKLKGKHGQLKSKHRRRLNTVLSRTIPRFETLKSRYWRPNFAKVSDDIDPLPPKYAALAPHLQDYEILTARVWLPYIMNGVYPRIKSASVNTDGYGFRYVISDEGRRLSPENGCEGPVSILTGGSTPFGVGVTSDAATIPSVLATQRNEPWFNLSVRGFTLAQNLVQTLFFLPRIGEVRYIVLCAGLNDINHFFKTQIFPKVYGSFYNWMQYFHQLNPQFFMGRKGEISYPESFNLLLQPIEDHTKDRSSFEDHLTNVLRSWKLIADAKNSRLCFVIQPVSEWMDRKLSPEEHMLFGDRHGKKQCFNRKVAKNYKEWYGEFLKNACKNLSIDFTDMNPTFGRRESESPRWLFLDNCHFTDDGAKETAHYINEILGPPGK
ncbi:MAG: hypothetical protein P8Y71_02540 [Pseudolabrys sp.]|jgi:lysophospholipase L1-like esterase